MGFFVSPRVKDIAIALGLAALAVATFWPVVRFDFVNYDDPWYIDNPHIRQGLTADSVRWAFTSTKAYWTPIDMLTHMADFSLFGPNPGGHHAASLAFHALNAVLLFALLLRMTGQRWCSALVAALFAVHPQNAESVAWITTRKELLHTLFALLAMLAYVEYAKRPRVWRYALVAALFALSLMTKPAFVAFPAVLLLLDYWPLKRWDSARTFLRMALEKLPLLAEAGVFALIAYLTQVQLGAIGGRPFSERFANAVHACVMYAQNTFVPVNLGACYPFVDVPRGTLFLSGFLILGISVTVIAVRKRLPHLFTGWFWFLVAVVPASGLLAQIGSNPRSDRFSYVPAIGLFIVAAWGIGIGLRRWPKIGAAVAVLVVVTFAAAANVQVRYWSDSLTLFCRSIALAPDNYTAHAFLGKTLMDQGRDADAAKEFQAALRIAPRFADAHNNYGNLLLKQGNNLEALKHYSDALRDRPNDDSMLYNMGLILLTMNEADKAIECFRKAIAINPDLMLAHNNLGYALAGKGAFEEAVAEYRVALRLDPKSALVLFNLGDALVSLGKRDEAIDCFKRAGEADPKLQPDAKARIERARKS